MSSPVNELLDVYVMVLSDKDTIPKFAEVLSTDCTVMVSPSASKSLLSNVIVLIVNGIPCVACCDIISSFATGVVFVIVCCTVTVLYYPEISSPHHF